MPNVVFTFAVHRPGHLAAVAFLVIATWACCWWGRRLRARGTEPKFRRALGWTMLAATLFTVVGYGAYALEEPGKYLPLQICDIVGLIAPVAVLTGYRPLLAILYFWGIGLTTQGFITPVVQQHPGEFFFWLFWINHFIIVFLALYMLIAGGYRPDRRDLLRTVGFTTAYATAIFFLNRATGWNYLYIGPTKPEATTLVDALGPYPLRVVWMMLLGLLVHVLIYLPWEIVRHQRRRTQAN